MDLSKNEVGENNTLSNNLEETISKTDTANSEMPELDTIIKIKGDEELLQETIDETYSIVTKTFIQGEVNVKYPQIQGLGDNDREQAINTLIKNSLFETQIDEQLKEVKYVVENHGIEEDYFLELEYEITMHTDKLLSILYTGSGAFKSSAFPTYSIYAITIDLEQVTTLSLSDFTNVDEELIKKMQASTNVTNGAVKDGMDKEDLLYVVQVVTVEKAGYIIEALKGEPQSYYTFAITPDSLLISIMIDHASGDYALIELLGKYT